MRVRNWYLLGALALWHQKFHTWRTLPWRLENFLLSRGRKRFTDTWRREMKETSARKSRYCISITTPRNYKFEILYYVTWIPIIASSYKLQNSTNDAVSFKKCSMLAAKLWQIAGHGWEEGLQRMMTLEIAIDKEVATMKKMMKR